MEEMENIDPKRFDHLVGKKVAYYNLMDEVLYVGRVARVYSVPGGGLLADLQFESFKPMVTTSACFLSPIKDELVPCGLYKINQG